MVTIAELLKTALEHHQAGRLADAEEIYRRILQAEPRQPDALHLLGAIAQQTGHPDQAADYFRMAIAADPNNAIYHNNLGLALAALGRTEEAIAAYQTALRLDPRFPEAYNNLANVAQALGRLQEAMAGYRRAIELRPDYAEAHRNLGVALWKQGQTLTAQGRYAEAEDVLRLALQHRPDFVEAMNHLGVAVEMQGRLDEAMGFYRGALRVSPDFAEAYMNVGDVLLEQGQVEEASLSYARSTALRSDANWRYRAATALPAIYQSIEHLHASRRRMVDSLAAMVADGVQLEPSESGWVTVFYLPYQGQDDRPVQETVARLCCRDTAAKPLPRPRSGARIRIGFVSGSFRDHSIGQLWRGLIARLSRDRFDVGVFSLHSADDPIAEFIAQHADRHVRLMPNVSSARQQLLSQDLDVLYYPDVGLTPLSYALAATRLAPVQCVSWGHPETTGLPTVDYYVSSDLLEPPAAESHYTEQLVRLRTLGLYVYRPDAPPLEKTRADFALPEDRHLYGCLQSLFKMHPDYDAILGDILRRDPRGVLVLPQGLHGGWAERLQQRFARTIPDVAARVRFIPRYSRNDYMQLLQRVDVLLAPPQFGGGQTSYQALSLGQPVVTMPGEFLRGRITHGLYRAIDVMDCVAPSADQYAELAVRLGTDPQRRQAVREKILAANHRLFEDDSAVREVEDFLLKAVAT